DDPVIADAGDGEAVAVVVLAVVDGIGTAGVVDIGLLDADVALATGAEEIELLVEIEGPITDAVGVVVSAVVEGAAAVDAEAGLTDEGEVEELEDDDVAELVVDVTALLVTGAGVAATVVAVPVAVDKGEATELVDAVLFGVSEVEELDDVAAV